MRRRKAPLWMRRLFHQRNPDGKARYASDIGLDGPGGDFEIGDHFQFEKLASAETDLDRVSAAVGYLRKVHKHMAYSAHKFGDSDLLEWADAEYQRLAHQIVKTVEGIRDEVDARGYSDLGEMRD